MNKDYKYDVAFSLCKEDSEFARKLKAQLNPNLKVFFYEHNQEEIISNSGPEVFGRVFKESRIVVILSRKEWGETFYTRIELHSINDRTKIEGYDFLVVIPMVPNEIPIWYPSTMIYADPFNLTLEVIAKILEYKVTEKGGVVKQLTLEEVHQHLLTRIAEKKKVVQLQSSKEALDSIQEEFKKVQELTIQKKEFIKKTNFWNTREQMHCMPFEFFFMVDNFLLEIKTSNPDEVYNRIVSTQDYSLSIQLYSVVGKLTNYYEESDSKKLIGGQIYKYLYNHSIKGWATQFIDKKHVSEKEKSILFSYRDPDNIQVTYWFYDLKNPVTAEVLIDSWFQELLKHASSSIGKYI